MTDQEWEERFGDNEIYDEDDTSRCDGTFALTAMDTTYLAHLIVTGKQAGKVVYLDWDEDYPPIWPKGSTNFLEWCENWFQEILAGYDISPGCFMYYEIGNEENLISSFHQHDDPKYKREVLYRILKFPFISETTIEFLKKNKYFDEKASAYVLKKFDVDV